MAAGASPVVAASLSLVRAGDAPMIADGEVLVANDADFGFTADSFGSSAATDPVSATGLSVSISALLSPTGAPLDGAFAVSDGGASFLSGALTDVGFAVTAGAGDEIEFLFSITGGSAAAAFGPLGLARLTGDFGDSPEEVFGVGFVDPDAALTIQPATVVPVPPALGLLIGALALLGLRGRRRR